jgi:hypothetical protein
VAGAPGDVAVVNLTPVGATAAGNGQLVPSDVTSPPNASNVNFGPGTIDPNVALAPIGTDGRVCFVNSQHANVDLVADHLGTIVQASYTRAQASGAPVRRVDTRRGLGCDAAYTSICLPIAPPDLSCADIPYRNFPVRDPDPHALDPDGDGVGCEQAAPPAPTPTPTPPPSPTCDPSYPTVCIPPPPPDLDCGDIPFRRFQVVGSDPHRFDRDGNGIGCES